MKGRAELKLLRASATILLLGAVFYYSGLFNTAGRRTLAETLAGTRIEFIFAAIAMNGLLDLVSAFKWRILSRALGLRGSTWELFEIYLSARFFNLVLPSNIGGDVLRVGLQARISGNTASAAASVLVDRLTGLITLVAFALVATLLTLRSVNQPLVTEAIIVTVAGLGLVLWMILDQRPFEFIRARLTQRFPRLDKLFTRMEKVRGGITLYRSRWAHLLLAFLVSSVFYLAAGVGFWVNIVAFDPTIPLLSVLIACPLMMTIMNLPLSIGNIGIEEFAYTAVLTSFGVPPAVAFSAALLHRLKTFLAAGVGGLLYNWVESRKLGMGR
ncbi:lysylphosphatidylglycerol synthase transmembrane domain-containing protein [Novosphingobium sp. 9U]|uniref:lysylphosphatidylglycerol synthase transmembrane domain-containing protein n=1 Tax=Novosphingobium sp. 9U TaxID=2653158 RepID=UPI0012F22574|nr:lysylphosphatidylglycerol synthase transmembrane domain-containing protein [Novosphingobium sp. 9U]VWX50461.1 conserved membrane hypothetical protein [Novosphingobium sp. 9U]